MDYGLIETAIEYRPELWEMLRLYSVWVMMARRGFEDLTRRGELIDKGLAPTELRRGAMTSAVQAHSLGTFYCSTSSCHPQAPKPQPQPKVIQSFPYYPR